MSGNLYSQLVESLTHGERVSLRGIPVSFLNKGLDTGEARGTAKSSLKPPSNKDNKAVGFNGKTESRGIQFGSPSQHSTASSKSGPVSTGLFEGAQSIEKATTNFLSGGLASILGGSFGSLGLGSLVSSIANLFTGGHSAPPPLIRFTLPSVENKTISVETAATKPSYGIAETPRYQQTIGPQLLTSVPQSTAAVIPMSASTPAPTLPDEERTSIQATGSQTNSSPQSNTISPGQVDQQWFLDRSNEIAKAVRNAMLNSSSLNDVIAEV